MYLSLAGNSNIDEVEAIAEKYFSYLPSKKTPQFQPAKFTSGCSVIEKNTNFIFVQPP